MQTSYDVLGVSRNASDETIKAAFRKAAKAYHPDLNAGDPTREQQFKQVIAAYELLRDPRQRAAYDEGLAGYERYLRSARRKRIWRFAAVPVAAVVSGAVMALGASLSSGPPPAAGPAGGEAAQLASQQVAAVDDGVSPRPAAHHAELRAREWKRVRASGDPMAIWGFAIRNPQAPETELARSKLAELIDTTNDVFTLQVLRIGAVDAIAERAQQRLDQLAGPALVEEEEDSRAPASNTLEERAAGFISAQISGWSSANATDPASLANAYADQVLYYGSPKSRQAVLRDKRHLLERWPERLYEVQPDSITVRCAAKACKIGGLIDWQTRSARRAASASGLARFEYQIILSGDAFSILGETSSVVRPARIGY